MGVFGESFLWRKKNISAFCCHLINNSGLFFSLPRQPGSRWALEQAKFNLVHNYLLVGVTEELGDFIAMLEVMLPNFFKGAMDIYMNS